MEQARLAPPPPDRSPAPESRTRPGVSELPRFWKFADTSHFVRAFKKQYGQTPAQYARSQDAPLP
ncbi:AraC family transcriptional regulator [Streptomyces sp. NPDC059272]|uniref:AraC family transcriptional regulator n=1 Tax=Streptomyces sp. NPDC059272 TaxID=3346800 RepID=UPI00368DB9C4